MDPQPRGPDWMQITPKAGSLFHANSHSTHNRGGALESEVMVWPIPALRVRTIPSAGELILVSLRWILALFSAALRWAIASLSSAPAPALHHRLCWSF